MCLCTSKVSFETQKVALNQEKTSVALLMIDKFIETYGLVGKF